MKTLKLLAAITAAVLFTCSNLMGQTIHTEATCQFDDYVLGYPAGIINGYVIYHFTINLSKETGKIESLHWVAKDCNIVNENGDVVKCIDAGHDTQGILWDFFNRPNYWNEQLYSDKCTYNVEDGWWNDIMPEGLPDEGTFVSMATKYMCNGQVAKMYYLAQLHRNAHGDITVNFVKP